MPTARPISTYHLKTRRAAWDSEQVSFLSLSSPKKTMISEAAAAGQFTMEGFDPVPRIQIVPIEEALTLRDRAVRLPARRDDTFRRAAREEDKTAQGKLDL